MRKITKFPKLVIEEAKNLKKNATKEELNKLNIDSLDPSNIHRCIYGQMTGDCHNERAVQLIKSSCKRVYEGKDGISDGSEDPLNKLNGSPKDIERKSDPWTVNFWSPIEVFVLRSQSANKNNKMNNKLIQFLKGERKVLK